MAITQCRECCGKVSTEAAECPHCGAPHPTSEHPELKACPACVDSPGQRICPSCEGTGRDSDGYKCEVCRDSGVGSGWLKCQTCGGSAVLG